MAEQQNVSGHAGKHLVTRRTGRCFKTEAAVTLDLDMRHPASKPETLTVVRAESGPAPGIWRQPVVDMNGIESVAETEFDEDVHEYDRIAAAGKADAQALIASRLGSEKRGNPGRETT